MVDEADGEGGDSGDGEGDVIETPPPPPPAKITLPPWLAKVIGPAISNVNKASAVPWLAQALEEACAPEHPVFHRAWHSCMIVLWFSASLGANLCASTAWGRGSGGGTQKGRGPVCGGLSLLRPWHQCQTASVLGGCQHRICLETPATWGSQRAITLCCCSTRPASDRCTCGAWIRPSCGPHNGGIASWPMTQAWAFHYSAACESGRQTAWQSACGSR